MTHSPSQTVDAPFPAQPEDGTLIGPEVILLQGDDDLTAGRPWSKEGYTVAPFLSRDEGLALREGIRGHLAGLLRSLGVALPEPFQLEDYHRCVDSDALHEEVIRRTRGGFPVGELPVDVRRLEDRVSELCGVPVRVLEREQVPAHFWMRIVRPLSGDNNPPHRDVWLPWLRSAINIYVPIAGSDASSSLTLVPGSHRWKESDLVRTAEGARVRGVRYSVPAVLGARYPLTMIRPDPGPDEVLVFSPYLVHGGARNLNLDCTRVSLEMRFARRTPAARARGI
jgi:hypothetical protein